MPLILQASDLHFGKPHDPAAAEALLATATELEPDLIVLAGDFTQRAKEREYREARAWIDRLPDVPKVFTPGNHDVPLYRVFERLFTPYRNYRRWIEDRLDTVTRIDGVTVVALNTAAPRTAIVNGTVRNRQLAFARAQFAEAPPADLRVVVLHHHMAVPGDWTWHPPLPGQERIISVLEECGVDLILSGHLHRGFVSNSGHLLPERAREILIVHSGTATSRRGRGREADRKSFNVVRVDREHLSVDHYMYFREAGTFRPIARHVSPRPPAAWIVPLDGATGGAS
ncbi:MAG: metallophosphoesterase [Gemmatimonadota bacterium]|nr:metallophosphoesterase [Gemmatimonadota bacterium]